MTRRLRANAGAKLRMPIASYAVAKAFYDARWQGRSGTKLAHNTTVEPTPDGGYAVRLYHTNIVTFYPNGTIMLDNGGHQTVTTKARMNEILRPIGLVIDQKDFEWYVREPASSVKPIPYFNGMVLRIEGRGDGVASVQRNPRKRTRRNGPGKFESSGALGEKLHELSMDQSWLDDSVGSSSDGGTWYGLLADVKVPGTRKKIHVIVYEDSQGFFDFTEYASAREARQVFDDIAAEVGDDGEGY